ncbi:MAG: hypothetical protein QW350_04860 [Candidatus Aenigmatarchaeota archaeon]
MQKRKDLLQLIIIMGVKEHYIRETKTSKIRMKVDNSNFVVFIQEKVL